jgi:hypothetical protein
MPHPNHPDDERLAAFAGAEPEALTDRELAAHIASCERCGPMVEDLRLLRSALAELPDRAPSRSLRFLPPVEERRRPRLGWADLVRRLTAPAMGLAVILILVGAVGSAGNAGLFSAGAGGAAGARPAADAAAAREQGSPAPSVAVVPNPGSAPPALAFGQSPSPLAGGDSKGGLLLTPPAGVVSGSSAPAPSAARAAEAPNPASRGPGQPPFEEILGLGVVLLAAAFATRGFLARIGAA